MSGYRSPEASEWNKYLEDDKLSRRRRLRGTFTRPDIACPAFYREANTIDIDTLEEEEIRNNEVTGNDSDVSEKLFEASKKEEILNCETLQHSDSNSSGVYSQDSSGRSHYSSRLSWDEESRSKFKVKNQFQNHKWNTLDDSIPDGLDSETFSGVDELPVENSKIQRLSAYCDDRSSLTSPPSCPSDIWSFGCLLVEVLTGRKLFQTGDKLASVLRPSQLLEMKLGKTEVAWSENGHDMLFAQVKDLILKCFIEDPDYRISASEALKHPLFSQIPTPSIKDMLMLQINLSYFNKEEFYPDILQEIKNQCQEIENVSEFENLESGLAFVHFQEDAWLIL